MAAASGNNVSLWKVLESPLDFGVKINAGTARKLADFRSFIASFVQQASSQSADSIASDLVKQSGMLTMLAQDRTTEGIAKLENVQELLKGIYEFCDIRKEEGIELVVINDYLAEISLRPRRPERC